LSSARQRRVAEAGAVLRRHLHRTFLVQSCVVVLTAAMTGLRQSELLGLRWRDVDYAHYAPSEREVQMVNEAFTEAAAPLPDTSSDAVR
jgi:hypothetical protein